MSHVIAPGRTNSFQLYHTLVKKAPYPNSAKMSRDQIGAARKLARHGHTVEQIRDAFGFTCEIATFRRELRKYNIRPHPPKNKQAHRGDETTLPHPGGFEIYKPREAAQ